MHTSNGTSIRAANTGTMTTVDHETDLFLASMVSQRTKTTTRRLAIPENVAISRTVRALIHSEKSTARYRTENSIVAMIATTVIPTAKTVTGRDIRSPNR